MFSYALQGLYTIYYIFNMKVTANMNISHEVSVTVLVIYVAITKTQISCMTLKFGNGNKCNAGVSTMTDWA